MPSLCNPLSTLEKQGLSRLYEHLQFRYSFKKTSVFECFQEYMQHVHTPHTPASKQGCHVFKNLLSNQAFYLSLPPICRTMDVCQDRSQALTPGWARYKHFLNPSSFSCRFSHFSSNFLHFLPHFGLPGGRLAHPGRPWLRHWCLWLVARPWMCIKPLFGGT